MISSDAAFPFFSSYIIRVYNVNGKNGNISSSIFVCTLKNSYRQKYQPGVYKPGWCNLLLLVFLFLELLQLKLGIVDEGGQFPTVRGGEIVPQRLVDLAPH